MCLRIWFQKEEPVKPWDKLLNGVMESYFEVTKTRKVHSWSDGVSTFSGTEEDCIISDHSY